MQEGEEFPWKADGDTMCRTSFGKLCSRTTLLGDTKVTR